MDSAKNSLIWKVVLVCLMVIVRTTAARTIYVDDDATGANDGSSWPDAYNYLQDGLAVAYSGDEIRVAQGVYKPDQGAGIVPGDRTATFEIINGVTIKGGYAGSGESDPDVRDVSTYETILSGDLIGDDGFDFANNGENSYHVALADNSADATAILDGFTISSGNANGPYPYCRGGGLYTYGGSPTVSNCIFNGNAARGRDTGGGGLWNYRGSPTVTNCTFIANSVDGEDPIHSSAKGGGMYNYEGNPSVMHCRFQANSVRGHSGGGGGVSNYEGNPTIMNCTFTNNTADGYDVHSDIQGGGIYNYSGGPMVSNCIFTENTASRGGGGFWNYEGNPSLTNCVFFANTAGEEGGGLWNYEGNPRVTNCTFSANSAGRRGGGLWNYAGSPTVTNSVLWDDTPEEIHSYFSGLVITYSDVEGGWPGHGNIETDPLFVDPASGDYHLQAGSRCIDAGDPNYIAGPNETDLDGRTRIIGGRIDMGAYEFGPVDWYVDDDAPNDPGPGDPTVSDPLEDGTQSHPFDVIREAIDAAWHGDTILVVEGTYFENIYFKGKNIILRSTSPDNPDTVAATIIDGGQHDSVVTFTGTENETCILSGFTIQNGFQDHNPPRGGGGICGGSQYNHTRATIKNNIITLNFSRDGGGLYWCDGLIENNIITANTARWFQGGGGLSQCNGIIRSNLIAGNFSGGCESGSALSYCDGTIENNTITNNSTDGDGTLVRCRGTIRNCIIWGNIGWPPQLNMCSTPSFSCIEGWGGGGDGNIDTDPCFVELGYWDVNGVWVEGDYHLLSDSPCIDAGDPNYIAGPNQTDLDGNPRILDGDGNGTAVVDMGAYEASAFGECCFGVNHLRIATPSNKKGKGKAKGKGIDLDITGTFKPAIPINLKVDEVTYVIDDEQGHTLDFTIPAGMFRPDGNKYEDQKFKFKSPKGSYPELDARFDFLRCRFDLKVKRAHKLRKLTGRSFTVALLAGVNFGEETVEVKLKGHHLEHKKKPKLDCCQE